MRRWLPLAVAPLACALGVAAWSCTSFSGADTGTDAGAADASPDAASGSDGGVADAAATDAALCAMDAGAILCDDFERADLTGGVWTAIPGSAPITTLHLASDPNGNRFLETVTTANNVASGLYLSRTVDVVGSAFTLDLTFGYQGLIGDGGGDQYINSFSLYFEDPTVDGGGSLASVFVKVDPAYGVELLLQASPTTLTDSIGVLPQPMAMEAPTHLTLHVDIAVDGSAKASLAGLTAMPVVLDGKAGKTRGHFAPKLHAVDVGDGFVAGHATPGARLRFDDVVLSAR
jgi:hypothetical protein